METNLYRKYRPNNFDQVVGQQVVVRTLLNSIKNDTIAHAYLFSGVRGTGKTSIAKIFAKAINCHNTSDPLCSECEICQDFANSSEVPDIFEIDAASNNGVEEIRKIIENVKYMPIRMKYKVYIIDEVHMLSKGAFNALLKTLEEPPAHVIFILATTEPNKIPVTILSRVQRFEFTRIDETLMLEHLQNVMEKEQVDYDLAALKLIVTHAGGGLRDALSLLTKVISYAPNVTSETVTESLNLAAKTVSVDLLEAIVEHRTLDVSDNFKSLMAGGVSEVYLVQDIIEVAKEKLVADLGNAGEQTLVYTKIISRLMEVLGNIKIISNSALYIEIALIELSIKPKAVAAPTMTAPEKPEAPVISEQEKVDRLKKQAEALRAQTSQPQSQPEIPKPKTVPAPSEDVEVQMDILFANKTGKDVSGLINQQPETPVVEEVEEPVVAEPLEEPVVAEPLAEPVAEEILAEPVVVAEVEEVIVSEYQYDEVNTAAEQSIASAISGDVVAANEPVRDQYSLDPALEQITIIDTLKHATKIDKQKAQMAAVKAADELNMAKQYGIAKFFEVSKVQGASPTGIVVSIEQNLFATYESRLAQIQHIYSNHVGSSVKVHLLTSQYWKQERMNFVRAVKENKEIDIYEEATSFFGKDMVNKVNS
ncbi:DNA polymerase III subunit gamma/tau [Mollicutes bacterium LVI A0039]|nr:DNA polymerase III subunit gamma/tau [Mollicutes bacterium LVI A0039]